jgi:hypothetical protein
MNALKPEQKINLTLDMPNLIPRTAIARLIMALSLRLSKPGAVGVFSMTIIPGTIISEGAITRVKTMISRDTPPLSMVGPIHSKL